MRRFFSDLARRVRRATVLEWCFLAALSFLALHYIWYIDDAFIYFRYVDNFLFLKLGFVYNQGEYVEGYSSPLWLFLLTLLRSTRVTYPTIVVSISLVTTALFGAMLVLLRERLAPGMRPWNVPLAYLAFNYGVASFFTSGLETPLVHLLAVAYALFLLKPESKLLELVVAASPLVRQELVLSLAVVVIYLAASRRRIPWRLVLLSATVGGGWLLFRVWYYADLFPNTFYLKDTVDLQQGIIYLRDTLDIYHFYALAAVMLIAALVLRYHARDTALRLGSRTAMLVAAAVVTLYIIKIGGDSRHYRYLAFPFCLAVCASSGLAERFTRRYFPAQEQWLAVAGSLVIAVIAFSSYPRQLNQHPFLLRESARYVNGIHDASGPRHQIDLHPSAWTFVTPDRMIAFRKSRDKFHMDDVEARFWCVEAYRKFNVRIVHSLGLTTPVLSRVDVKTDRPGHKWDLRDYANGIVAVQRDAPVIGVGMYGRAAARGAVKPWMLANMSTLGLLELKTYNSHHFFDNLRLAFTPVPRIHL